MPHNFNVGTLEVVPGEEHSVVGTTRSRQTEHHCRLGIEGVQRQQRMEDKPSDYLSLSKGMRNRPVCFSSARPASQVRKLEPEPRGHARGCSANELGTLPGLCVSTFQSDSNCIEQSD